MKVDRESHIWKIRRRHWEGLAVSCDLDPDPLINRITEVVASVPAAIKRAASGVREEGIDHEIVGHLEKSVREHSGRCLAALQ